MASHGNSNNPGKGLKLRNIRAAPTFTYRESYRIIIATLGRGAAELLRRKPRSAGNQRLQVNAQPPQQRYPGGSLPRL